MFLRGAAAGGAAIAVGTGAACAPMPRPDDPLGAGPHPFPRPVAGRDRWARIPAAFNRRVTAETSTTGLRLLSGAVPTDLAGHVFFQSLALQPSDAGFSGDGLIWRVDLDGESPAVTSRLLRTTDYLMAEAFADTRYRFESRGMTRLGPLGLQNQPNTALVALDGNRLIATVDGGRPWELDPETLDPVGPVGRLDDYRPMLDLPFNRFLCPMTITSAHPPYDAETGEYYGISLSIVPLPGMAYTEVLAWEGSGSIKRVPVLTPDLNPLLISQNAHQIAVTRHHLVILDAAGTIEYAKLLNPPNSAEAGDASPPRPESYFYVIDRDDIRRTKGSVVAQRAVIARESGHFMVDYESSRERLVIHSAHTSASDFAEWIQPYDVHPDSGAPVRSELVNAITPVNYDIGVVGRYEIDARTGCARRAVDVLRRPHLGHRGSDRPEPAHDERHARRRVPRELGFPDGSGPAARRQGLRPPPLPTRGDGRAALGGRAVEPGAHRPRRGRVVDAYFYPGDRFGWTPTFVPRRGSATGSADGYLVAVVYGDQVSADSAGTELWIFRADDLASGPVARLGGPDLQVPLTLHSVWLDSTRSSSPDERIDVAGELLERAATWHFDPEVAGTLRSEVLPAYEALLR